jgi:hypothetical protein
MSEKIAVVFVCNEAYYHNFRMTCYSLLTAGQYKGDIVLVVGNDLYDKETENLKFRDELVTKNNIQIKYFPDYEFEESFLEYQRGLNRDSFWFQKRFQYHKFNLFDTFFKQWSYILYMDCGMHIFSDITPILNDRQKNKMVANRDGVDNETAAWTVPETPNEGLKIGDQFIKTDPVYEMFKLNYNTKAPYFQTTVMLFDTDIIDESTVSELYKLLFTYPISLTNDQGIISLYFTQEKPCWVQMRRKNENTYFYDYVRCVFKNYIMLKSMDSNFIHIGYNDD